MVSIFFLSIFFDLTTEVACFYTSKKYVSKVFIPKSLSNYRLFSGIVSTTVKIGPLCSKVGSFIVAGLGFTEFGYPMATGGLNEPGVLTKAYMNNLYYNDLSFPIKTRADICYENAWHGYEEDVQAGARYENPLKKRTYSIRTVKDLIPLGMSEKDKHIFPSLSSD